MEIIYTPKTLIELKASPDVAREHITSMHRFNLMMSGLKLSSQLTARSDGCSINSSTFDITHTTAAFAFRQVRS